MKKTLLSILSLALIFFSCKKSNPSSSIQPGFTATLNGKVISFGANVSVDTTSGQIDIMGSTDSLGGFPYLEVAVYPVGALKTGLYVNQALVGLNTPTSVLNYVTSDPTGNSNQRFFQSLDDSVTVTSVSSTSISGTFHGHVGYKTFDPYTNIETDSVITITNGSFNIKL